ncbi:MAG: long-chain fatty acid--CoA ligase, partial [Actinomycetota bacterium]|nr:long-chain fatty acid--CoA ligase [Actinomycetota bacterium]
AVLEDRMGAHHLISQAMVVGEGRPFIGALITLDPDAVSTWASAHDKAGRMAAELHDDPDLHQEIQAAVDDANAAVSRAESIRAWRLIDAQFSEESGHMTPTLKLKRAAVATDYAAEIDALYR